MIGKVSELFSNFKGNVLKSVHKISTNELVALFVGIVSEDPSYQVVDGKKIVKGDKTYSVDKKELEIFMFNVNQWLPGAARGRITEVADRLIDDEKRRNEGKFYTPTVFVDYAHKEICKTLGDDWYDKYVVWDNSCGTKNLTRDYKFKELYCSTIDDNELEISKAYNTEATAFNFDFLNDPIDKLPKGLVDALENDKPIVFLMNPPYGTPTVKGGVKGGATSTMVSQMMAKDKIIGKEFVNQFLYRIMKLKIRYRLTNCVIACYTNPSWLTKANGEKLREVFLENFEFCHGHILQASNFANVKSSWAITFNIWKTGKTIDKHNFVHDIVCPWYGEVKHITNNTKILYNLDKQDQLTTAPKFFNRSNPKEKQKQRVLCSTDIKHMKYEARDCMVYDGFIASVVCPGNDVNQNNMVCIRNTMPGNGCGIVMMTKHNFKDACFIYSIRKTMHGGWLNIKDSYMLPKGYVVPEEMQNDCIIYALATNYCASIRQDEVNMKNELFWMSKKEMERIYKKPIEDNERHAYLMIKDLKLSEEAQALLDMMKGLVEVTYRYREPFNESHPEYQIMNWDCGIYQIKCLLKEYEDTNKLNKLKECIKALGHKIAVATYELGLI